MMIMCVRVLSTALEITRHIFQLKSMMRGCISALFCLAPSPAPDKVYRFLRTLRGQTINGVGGGRGEVQRIYHCCHRHLPFINMLQCTNSTSQCSVLKKKYGHRKESDRCGVTRTSEKHVTLRSLFKIFFVRACVYIICVCAHIFCVHCYRKVSKVSWQIPFNGLFINDVITGAFYQHIFTVSM